MAPRTNKELFSPAQAADMGRELQEPTHSRHFGRGSAKNEGLATQPADESRPGGVKQNIA